MLELEKFLEAGSTSVSNLLFNYYQELGLTNEEFLLYLQLLHNQQAGSEFPDLIEISQKINVAKEDIYGVLEGLMGKKMIAIVTTQNSQGKTADAYDLTPIYGRLNHYLASLNKKNEQMEQESGVQALFELFEKEFGRPLSPIELETIGMWIKEDKYDLEIIRLGLREAVLNQAYSLKYIDRILLSWERKNLTSKAQIMTEQNRRKKSIADNDRSQGSDHAADLPKVPLYNWLDPNNQS